MERLADRPLVVLDTETATLSGAPHLLELGAVRVLDGEIVERFESLVRPQVEIEPGATAYHGLRDEDVFHAPAAGEVLGRFAEWLGADWMVAHDAPYDARVLAFEAARWGVELPDSPMLDTLVLARKFLPEAPDHKLPTLCEWLELEELELHRALADAVACFKVLEACAERLEPPATAAKLLAACGLPTTFASRGPGTPRRLKPRLRALARACESSERPTVRLIYGHPDQPPVTLPVVPNFLFETRERSYLEAECQLSGQLKTYRLDRIHKVLT